MKNSFFEQLYTVLNILVNVAVLIIFTFIAIAQDFAFKNLEYLIIGLKTILYLFIMDIIIGIIYIKMKRKKF